MKRVVVIDYGMGNIKSVLRAIEHVGGEGIVSKDRRKIVEAGRLILPGVGAFKDGMLGLCQTGLMEALNIFVESGKQLLGICLGMQMLLDSSEEHGHHAGFGYIPGRVVKLPKEKNGKDYRKIPHIGWTAIRYPSPERNWEGSVLESLKQGEYFYFVHSYMAQLQNPRHILAECEYDGLRIAAAIQKENITGLQFHPEKSGAPGLSILREFLNVDGSMQ